MGDIIQGGHGWREGVACGLRWVGMIWVCFVGLAGVGLMTREWVQRAWLELGTILCVCTCLCVEGMASSRARHDEAKVSKVGESRTPRHYVVTGSEVAAGAWLELGTVKLDRASENINDGVE